MAERKETEYEYPVWMRKQNICRMCVNMEVDIGVDPCRSCTWVTHTRRPTNFKKRSG